ncbi:class I SAM-dependent methyltransferase [Candidatus Woesearchaeota archaeon]|nr:class I SAM-dependent methyltransferase [Candidatus Woesearchaeota archaeon]
MQIEPFEKLVQQATEELYRKHPWLRRKMIRIKDETVVEYSDAQYYQYILPRYLFEGVEDTEKLEEWFLAETNSGSQKFKRVLELACGNGRGTRIVAKYANELDAVDLSPSMISSAQTVKNLTNVRFYRGDMFEFTNKLARENRLHEYDLIFSFWGIFYGTNDEFITVDQHGNLLALDPQSATQKAERNLRTLFDNLTQGTQFLFFHVRSDTEEQLIYRPIIGAYCSAFMPPRPTPSEIILKKVLDSSGVDYQWRNVGGFVEYPSLEKALEVNLNFHLKGFFNDRLELPIIYLIISNGLHRHIQEQKVKMSAGYIHIEGVKR